MFNVNSNFINLLIEPRLVCFLSALGEEKKSLSPDRNKIQLTTVMLLDLPTSNVVFREICFPDG